MNPFDQIKEAVQNCPTVLVGIGQEWSDQTPVTVRKEAYETLARLLKWSNYFIVTMNTDDEIYETELDSKHIVAPFGSVHRFQCEHGCEGKLWTVETVPTDRICPVCGGAIVPNTKDCEKYVEAGYLQDWQAYTDWLTHTLNQEMTILELGVGFEMPSVVRWPFERIAFLNQKAHFIRVHKIWHQLSEELSETNRAKSVASDSCGLFAEEREQKEEKDGSNQQ